MEFTHLVSVAALVHNEAGQILLVKSHRRDWDCNLYTTPIPPV